MKADSDRLLSATILRQILLHKGSLTSQQALLNQAEDSNNNHALIQEFCYGVCRHYHQLEFICSSLLQKPLRTKDTDIKCLILIGLYQLLFMRIPPHAAINETVCALNGSSKSWAKGLINAILREAQRQHPSLQDKIDANYCYKYSHPDWLISALKKSWPQHYQEILVANNERAPMTLRLNLSLSTREQYLESLASASISARAGGLSTTAIILEQAVPVQQLPGFDIGLISVQDEASQLCAPLLQLEPGQRILDACAAPGGKTCAILEHEPKLQELVAIDCEQSRLQRVIDNLARTGLSATTFCADINSLDSWWDGALFDRILLDVPCSATGVIRRHPDIKLLRKADDIQSLMSKQKAILDTAWSLLKVNGIMLYSTCSLLLDENSHQLTNFINEHADAMLIPIDTSWGIPCKIGRQLLPGSSDQDGFYFALLQKC